MTWRWVGHGRRPAWASCKAACAEQDGWRRGWDMGPRCVACCWPCRRLTPGRRLVRRVQVVAFDVGVAATAAIINAHTGAILDTLAAPVAAADLLHLPQAAHDGTADQHVYALVPAGEGGEPQLLPDTALGRAAFAAARPTLSFWRADEQAGTIRGLGFTGGWVPGLGQLGVAGRSWASRWVDSMLGLERPDARLTCWTGRSRTLTDAAHLPPACLPSQSRALWRSAGPRCWRQLAAAAASSPWPRTSPAKPCTALPGCWATGSSSSST